MGNVEGLPVGFGVQFYSMNFSSVVTHAVLQIQRSIKGVDSAGASGLVWGFSGSDASYGGLLSV